MNVFGTEMRKSHSALLIRTILFSVVLMLPAIYEYVNSTDLSPGVFCDWDEPFYLKQTVEIGKQQISSLIGPAVDRPTELSLLYFAVPNNLTDIALGKLAKYLGFGPVELNLALDFFCFFFSYFIFAFFFRHFLNSQLSAELVSGVLLLCPWLFSIENYFTIPIPDAWPFTTFTSLVYPCVPVFRSVYTQVSYPVAGLALAFGFINPLTKVGTSRRLFLAGILSGCLLYIYFFAWLSLSVIIGLWLLSQLLLVHGRFALRDLLAYGLGNALASSLGVCFLLNGLFSNNLNIAAMSLNLPDSMQGVWFFSLERGVLFLCLLILALRRRKIEFFVHFALVLIAAEFILLNIQPVLGKVLTPYHFSLFYIHPLLTACLAALIIKQSDSLLIAKAAAIVFATVCAIFPAIDLIKDYQRREERGEVTALLQAIEKQTSTEAIIGVSPAVVPFHLEKGRSLLPVWIHSLTGRKVLGGNFNVSDMELAASIELTLGWLFSGQLELIGGCNYVTKAIRSDAIEGTKLWWAEYRSALCDVASRVKKDFHTCDKLRALLPTHLVLDKRAGNADFAWIESGRVLYRGKRFKLIELSEVVVPNLCLASST